MKSSSRIALGGILSGVALVVMLFSFIEFGGYIFPAIAGVVISLLMLEIDGKSAFGGYVAVSLLSLILVASLDSKLIFIMFFGYYPAFKIFLERKILNKKLGYLIKYMLFNVTVVGCHLILFYVFSVDPEMFEVFGVNLPLVFLLLGNVTFFLYDRSLNGFYVFYYRFLKDKLNRLFKK